MCVCRRTCKYSEEAPRFGMKADGDSTGEPTKESKDDDITEYGMPGALANETTAHSIAPAGGCDVAKNDHYAAAYSSSRPCTTT